ncbi:MAG: ABC transporter substrate-binding protein [Dehalococcoidia bacterium]|nr:ABC transporter substrate-binding protein [Dehalococcoidia bacterium]
MRRLLAALALASLVLLLGVACEEEQESTPTAGGTPSAAQRLRPGAAGIPSNPRQVRGLEGILTLDDGLAIFRERPASEDRTGVTPTTIKLGRYTGLTSPLISAYEAVWTPTLQAIIRRINEAGGIHGRRIELVQRDDQYNPAVTVQVVRELVERDQVFALFWGVGNPSHQAIKDYVLARGVPELWVYDGSTSGLEPTTQLKNTFPGIVADMLEGIVMATAIMKEHPRGRVAVVYQNDPLGAEFIQSFRSTIRSQGGTIVAEIGFDVTATDMSPFVQQALNASPNAVAFYGTFATALGFMRAVKERNPTMPIYERGALPAPGDIGRLMDGVAFSSQVKAAYTHPNDRDFQNVVQKLRALAQEEGIPYNDALTPLVLRAVEHLVRALEMAGPDLTRQGLVEAIESGFDGSWTCSLCVGPTVLGPQDHWTYETSAFIRWRNDTGLAEFILPYTSFETSEGKGIRGNVEGFECRPGTCPWKEGAR